MRDVMDKVALAVFSSRIAVFPVLVTPRKSNTHPHLYSYSLQKNEQGKEAWGPYNKTRCSRKSDGINKEVLFNVV
jgi:hypothetical protein